MSNELMIQEFEPVVKQSGLEKAETYAAVFAPFMITLKQLTDNAAGINRENPSPVDAKLARELRLAMVKNRTASEKEKDKGKAALLAEGNLIQNLYNIILNSSKISEADLDSVEKFAENKEKERKAALAAERAGKFAEYNTDLTGYDLGSMADNVFNDLLESQRLLHEKRIEDAAKAEADRIAAEKAELERQAALKAENERLKAEADKLQAEKKEIERLANIEADKQAALLKAEKDKAAAEKAEADKKAAQQAAELKAAQDAAAKAAKELQDKKDAEAKAESDRVAAEKKAAMAPVKEKLSVAVNSLSLVLPESEITADIMAKFNGFKAWAIQQVNSL